MPRSNPESDALAADVIACAGSNPQLPKLRTSLAICPARKVFPNDFGSSS
jgi:hypothetical protein